MSPFKTKYHAACNFYDSVWLWSTFDSCHRISRTKLSTQGLTNTRPDVPCELFSSADRQKSWKSSHKHLWRKKNSCPYPEISFSPAAQNRKNELLKFMLIDRSPLPKRSLGRNRSADLKLLRKWLKIMKRSLAWAIMERWNGPEPEPSPSFKSQALVKVYLQNDGLRGCFLPLSFDASVAFLRKIVVI